MQLDALKHVAEGGGSNFKMRRLRLLYLKIRREFRNLNLAPVVCMLN